MAADVCNFSWTNFFGLVLELKVQCFCQICRRRTVKDGIDEVILRFGRYGAIEYDGRTSIDADRASRNDVFIF